MECDGGQHETDNHARCGPNHNLPAPDDVNVLQGEEGEEEVRARDNQTDSCRLVEANFLEEGS